MQTELINEVRKLDPEDRVKVGMELLETARFILGEAEPRDDVRLLVSQSPRLCAQCPYAKASDM